MVAQCILHVYVFVYLMVLSVCDCVVKQLSAEKEKNSQLEMRHHRVNLAYADVKSQIQHGDYKIENYDRVKTSV